MSWVSGNCQGDRRFECYYAAFDNFDEQWCKDSDSPCFDVDDGGGLIKVIDHQASSGGGW
jgi:hypothetical protein